MDREDRHSDPLSILNIGEIGGERRVVLSRQGPS